MKTKQQEEEQKEEEKQEEESTEETNEEEKAEESTEEESKEEESKEEESSDESVEEVANKIVELVNKKSAEINKTKEVKEKKKAVFNARDVSLNDYEMDFYQKRSGEQVKIKKSEAEHLGKWFKYFASWKKEGNPDTYQAMKKELHYLENMAYNQKLEPMQTGVAAEGGNLVPTILYNKLIPLLEDMAVIRQNAFVIDMKGIKTLDLPGIASKPYVSWNSETAQKATTSVEFNKISLTPYILAGIIAITQQLIDDSPFNVIRIVSQLLAEAIAKEEDRAFMMGSGTGQPTGITTYTAAGIVNAGGALRFNHFNDAYFAMPQQHRNSPKAAWIMHRRTIQNVMNMVDGNNRPIVDIFNPLNGPGVPRIRGAKVLEQNDMSDNEIWFVDLNYYWIGYSRTLSIDTAKEATIGGKFDSAKGGGTYLAPTNLWERNMIAIRAEEKVDGELVTTRAAVEIQAVRT